MKLGLGGLGLAGIEPTRDVCLDKGVPPVPKTGVSTYFTTGPLVVVRPGRQMMGL